MHSRLPLTGAENQTVLYV